MDLTTLRQSISTQMVTATGMLRERSAYALDTVEEQLAFLVTHQLIVEALNRFLEGDPPKTLGLRYTGGGHEDHPLRGPGLGVGRSTAGATLYLTSLLSHI